MTMHSVASVATTSATQDLEREEVAMSVPGWAARAARWLGVAVSLGIATLLGLGAVELAQNGLR